jgi:coenzyme F420 hydrogenase subunit beta
VADIACGDAWESYEGKDMGRSIVLVRTRRGQKILRKAMESNYVHLEPITGEDVLKAQPNLLQRRKELFGRLAGMTLLGIPIPRYKNFSLFRSWIRLPFFMKLRTLTGTVWRALQRGWCRRQMLFRLGQTSK